MKQINKCKMCQKEHKNKKFCSMSCSASYNNVLYPKRELEGICRGCRLPTKTTRVYCQKCSKKTIDMTLDEATYHTKNSKPNAFSLIRGRARTIAKNLGLTKCAVCQYSKHVEIAHKKAISEHSGDTPISVINHPSNLIALCPNCHWESHNGFLSL